MKPRRDMGDIIVMLAIAMGLLLAAAAFAFFQATRADAGVNPPCQVTGHLSATPGHVTAVFTVAATCREVSLLSWLAPDAHAGLPQVLYDRRSQSDVPPGDYRWTITAPPPGCFFQDDLRVPGHNVDALLGGDHVCQPPPTTTSSTTTSLSTTTSTSEVVATSSSVSSSTIPGPPPSSSTKVSGSGEMPNTGGGELWAVTLAALGLIGLGRWAEWTGRKRRERHGG